MGSVYVSRKENGTVQLVLNIATLIKLYDCEPKSK